ncbi:four helix bundle protein [Kordia sp.]|uniref:four helix bundle protein n=1 Tax=Kordia sp. TaxID=1965332 RepID=UPI003D27652A
MRKSKYHFKFEDLGIYSKAMEFGEIINDLVRKFPKEERFELTSQFKRAADSIALNIAEGASGTDKQFCNYLANAWHSAHEYISCSSKAQMRNYISSEEDEENRRLITELSKMMTSLRSKILQRIK